MRKVLGLTRAELADLLGYSESAVRAWEDADDEPAPRTILTTLGAMIRDLVRGDDATRRDLDAMRAPDRSERIIELSSFLESSATAASASGQETRALLRTLKSTRRITDRKHAPRLGRTRA